MPDPCCAAFERALHPGTDNESYGQLIAWRAGAWHTGTFEPKMPLVFCPWCGVKL